MVDALRGLDLTTNTPQDRPSSSEAILPNQDRESRTQNEPNEGEACQGSSRSTAASNSSATNIYLSSKYSIDAAESKRC